MYLAGYLFDFPVTISTFFGEGTAIYNVVDIQSLICAALIFTMMFYYPLRMIINPCYARTFWRRSLKPIFYNKKPIYISLADGFGVYHCTFVYASGITHYCGLFYAGDFYSLYPGISRLSYALISLLWAASAFLLLTYNYNFLNG
jgi:hypothetical protein